MRVVRTSRIELVTYGPNKLFDVTDRVAELARGVEEGAIVLQAVGSTGALVVLPKRREVIEAFENDLWDLVPTLGWRHPGNAYAHLRSTFIGTTLALPIVGGSLPIEGNGIFFLENQPALNRRRVVVAAVVTRG
ncbi:MAG: YjbQ family protein [Thermofilaceae archaeon]